MLDPLFFIISRLNKACFPLVINLQINYLIGIKDIPFLSFQLGFPMYVIQGVLFCSPKPEIQGSLVPGDPKYFKKFNLFTSPEKYSMNIIIKTKACFFNIRGKRTTDRDGGGAETRGSNNIIFKYITSNLIHLH